MLDRRAMATQVLQSGQDGGQTSESVGHMQWVKYHMALVASLPEHHLELATTPITLLSRALLCHFVSIENEVKPLVRQCHTFAPISC